MDYKAALGKLEAFRDLVKPLQETLTGDDARRVWERVPEAYGEIEDIVLTFTPRRQVKVDAMAGKDNVYPNFIESAYLSGRTFHSHEGYAELLKVIGKVKQRINDPSTLPDETSVTKTVQVLSRLRECCQYMQQPPRNERAVQDIVWIMLRSHHDRLDREDTLARFGAKKYIPDFGIPDLKVLIEVKFIGEPTNVGSIQEEILADIPPYLADQARYVGIIVLVYDAAHKLRDPRKFLEDLKGVEGIVDVIVIPGIG